MFQDLVELEREELDMTQEYSSDTEPSGLLGNMLHKDPK